MCNTTESCHWNLERNEFAARKGSKSSKSILNYVYKDYINWQHISLKKPRSMACANLE